MGPLRRLLDKEKVDCAYVLHTYHQLGTRLLSVLDERRIPTVLSLHDYKAGCPNYRFYSEKSGLRCTRCLGDQKRFLAGPIVERCWNGSALAGLALSIDTAFARQRGDYQSPSIVTVLNELQREAVIGAGVSPERIVRSFHPVAVEDAPPRESRDGSVLYVGRLAPEKGVDDLVAACALTGQRLIVAGDGRERPLLASAAAKWNVDAQFLGRIGSDDVRALMRSCGMMAVPSVWDEVWPFTVLEGIACGIPIVATNVGGMSEQLAHGRGLLVSPRSPEGLAQALQEVANNPIAAFARAEVARRYARDEWTNDRWGRHILDLLDQARSSFA